MASFAETQLAHLTDADIKPSILSQPLTIFEDRASQQSTTPSGIGLVPTLSGNAVPRGRIWTNDNGLPAKAFGNQYTFSYNPSSLDFSTVWDPTIPVYTTGGASQSFGNIHPSSPETISFQLLMNRILEVMPSYTGPSAALFSIYGTICDLSVMFRTINGLTDDAIDQALQVPVPVVPATNLGWLTAALCTVSFGNGDFNWSGYVTALDVNHAKFVDSMTPVLTTVTVSMTRTLAAGTTGDNGTAVKSGAVYTTPTSSGGNKTANKPTTPKTTPKTPTATPAPGA